MTTDTTATPELKTATKPKAERPKLHKVLLLNDDYTPREFVVRVLKAVFRIGGETAHTIMMTAHQKGACVVSVYPAQVAETKANEANAMAQDAGHPLQFTTEPEE
ncbi:ATP-dependent Clp protease adaptor ClpS [Acuticoccus sp. I52.16.1]|uniref:ATP-dependent Clp protease adaptor ClpS n=1 Tax=Acuticoccus sp. I52.16.1 TaxID=2928472 RepID=UPI001FD1EE18|nr:ATP-dependent Clp protease adaptor ClpS [Acuticoccus sp. I52.16.1]UOM33686.1 ATP-dependent Clp protease adaptor ClpS [Acuticoccus sp. I52.16.1]